MQLPPDLQVAGAAPTIGPNVSTLSLTIPAPGAGFRLRIWTFAAGPWTHNLAAGTSRWAITNPAGSAFDTIGYANTQGAMGGQHVYPGGLARPANEGVSVFGIATVAGTYFLSLTYTIEAA